VQWGRDARTAGDWDAGANTTSHAHVCD
jgi:hypothetical protein